MIGQPMIEITYSQLSLLIVAAWLAVRSFFALKHRRVEIKRELLLLTALICLMVIARLVYFPASRVNDRIGPLRFDAARLPGPIQPVPFARMFEKYDGWKLNLIGNIAMFIPVGIFWPLCFKRLDNIIKATAAGFALSLFIELSQLAFYERTSDANDLILNTFGTLIGASAFFLIRFIMNESKKRVRVNKEE